MDIGWHTAKIWATFGAKTLFGQIWHKMFKTEKDLAGMFLCCIIAYYLIYLN